MNKYQLFSLGHYLSEWPDNMAFNDIIEGLKNDHEDISPRLPYEDLWGQTIAYLITDMVSNLQITFIGEK